MITPFSIRHRIALDKKKLTISIDKKTRQKIIFCLKDHNEFYGWNGQDSRLHDDLENVLLRTYGETKLKAYDNNGNLSAVKGIENFILGAWPPRVLDTIELFHDILEDFDNSSRYKEKINFIFLSDNIPLRFCDNYIIKLDSSFLESEILGKVSDLLSSHHFDKAKVDFLNARNKFTASDYTGTVTECNNAIESALKKTLNKTKGEQGDLKKHLMKSGLIPDYFQGFSDHFEGLLQSCFTIANESSRHGKKDIPSPVNKIDHAVASFVLHLTGTLLLFIMERYKEKQPKSEEKPFIPDEDVPF